MSFIVDALTIRMFVATVTRRPRVRGAEAAPRLAYFGKWETKSAA